MKHKRPNSKNLERFWSRASDSPATYGALQMCFDLIFDLMVRDIVMVGFLDF